MDASSPRWTASLHICCHALWRRSHWHPRSQFAAVPFAGDGAMMAIAFFFEHRRSCASGSELGPSDSAFIGTVVILIRASDCAATAARPGDEARSPPERSPRPPGDQTVRRVVDHRHAERA